MERMDFTFVADFRGGFGIREKRYVGDGSIDGQIINWRQET
jgi:hypothetical protein